VRLASGAFYEIIKIDGLVKNPSGPGGLSLSQKRLLSTKKKFSALGKLLPKSFLFTSKQNPENLLGKGGAKFRPSE
jgi:hypothetical protein